MKITERDFENQEVILDFHDYNTCNFKNCRMVFHGHAQAYLNNCVLDRCAFEFRGPALATLHFLTAMYHGNSEGFRQFVEDTFENIRRGPVPPSPPLL